MTMLKQELAGMKILIVDDTPANIDVLKKTLTHYGFNIFIAPSGEIALKTIPKTQPDLILLDIMMPGINGFETCRRLKADKATRDIPIIFLTAKVEANDIVKGFSLGGADYITKPFCTEELLARIETQLKLHKTTKDLKNEILSMHEAKEDSIAKSEFLSRMSHELKTPLHSVLGFAQLLEMSQNPALSEEQQQSIDQITSAGRHLLKLIEEVLDTTDLDSGNLKVLSEQISLKPVLEEALKAVAPEAKKRQITLNSNATPQETIFVKGEKKRIKQILIALLFNAIKYNKEAGSVAVNMSQNNGVVATSIKDTGEGIPQGLTEQIFEPLFRQEHHKTLVGGIGMGLTTVKKLTEIMNGKIKVESQPGEGSCFTLELPLYEDTPERLFT